MLLCPALWRGRLAHRTSVVSLVVALVGSSPAVSLAQPKPDPADVAEAKRYFEMGLKLYKEKQFVQALAAFKEAKRRQPRPSIQKNLAQCYRELGDFAAAHAAFSEWLDKYGSEKTVKPKEVEEIKRAISDLLVLTGTLKLNVSEPDASVVITPTSGEERDLGKSPIAEPVRLNLGTYKVTVSKAGFEKLTRSVEIRAREEISLDATLKKEITAATVKVSTTGDDPSARLLIDGQEVGALPWSGELSPGTHKLSIRAEKTKATQQEIKVVSGQEMSVVLELLAQSGKLQIDTRNADAEIYVDDKQVATGAWEGSLSIGRHEIEVRLEGYESYRRVVLVHNEEVIDVGQVPLVKKVKKVDNAEQLEPTYKGGYFAVALPGTFSVSKPTNELQTSCPAEAVSLSVGGSCEASRALGGGLLLRGGYSFGVIGLEGFMFGSFDRSTGKARYDNGDHNDDNNVIRNSAHEGISRNESYTFYRYGGGAGVGVRATSKHPFTRVTFGVGGGIAQRWMKYDRDTTAKYPNSDGSTSAEKFTSDATSYTAPLLSIDTALLVGATPGVKFMVGVQALFEFVPSTDAPGKSSRHLGFNSVEASIPVGTPPVQVAKGTQIFIGPMLGFQFGN
ncbi:MAG: PEGA domain-containing protein [Polyangiaceae bacterium]